MFIFDDTYVIIVLKRMTYFCQNFILLKLASAIVMLSSLEESCVNAGATSPPEKVFTASGKTAVVKSVRPLLRSESKKMIIPLNGLTETNNQIISLLETFCSAVYYPTRNALFRKGGRTIKRKKTLLRVAFSPCKFLLCVESTVVNY